MFAIYLQTKIDPSAAPAYEAEALSIGQKLRLIVGDVLPILSVMVLTVPIFFPLAASLGFDPVWLDRSARTRNQFHHVTIWIAALRDERGCAQGYNDARNLCFGLFLYRLLDASGRLVNNVSTNCSLVAKSLALWGVTDCKTFAIFSR